MKRMGRVYLVGAGPGDPGLFTLRGREVLEKADVVLYDFLANPRLLAMAPQAELRFVGKRAKAHSLKQEAITGLVLNLARREKPWCA